MLEKIAEVIKILKQADEKRKVTPLIFNPKNAAVEQAREMLKKFM